MMKKQFWKSKTVQGAFVFAVVTFLTQTGWVPEHLLTEFIQWASGFWTVYGVRNAMS